MEHIIYLTWHWYNPSHNRHIICNCSQWSNLHLNLGRPLRLDKKKVNFLEIQNTQTLCHIFSAQNNPRAKTLKQLKTISHNPKHIQRSTALQHAVQERNSKFSNVDTVMYKLQVTWDVVIMRGGWRGGGHGAKSSSL